MEAESGTIVVEPAPTWRALRVIFPDGSDFIAEDNLRGPIKQIAGLALAQLGCVLFISRDCPSQWEYRGIACNFRAAWEFCFGADATKLKVELVNEINGEVKVVGSEILGINPMEDPFLRAYREMCMMSGVVPRLTLETT